MQIYRSLVRLSCSQKQSVSFAMRALPSGLGTSSASTFSDSVQQVIPTVPTHGSMHQHFRLALPRSHQSMGIRLNPLRPCSFSLHAASFNSSASGWGADSSGDAKKISSAKVVTPKAADCDDAIEDYDQLRSRLDNLKKPSSMKSWDAVAKDLLISTGSIMAMIFRFTIAIPSYFVAFSKMSKEEWAVKKSNAWKVVKHEWQHYVVSGGCFGVFKELC